MDNQRFITQTKEMLPDDLSDETLTYYLTEAGAEPDSIPGIIETAKTEYAVELCKIYTRKNKFSYYLWLSFSVVGFISFLFVLPWLNFTVDRVFICSIVGAVFCCASGFLAWAYRKTWEPEFVQKHGRPKIQLALLFAVCVIPSTIVYFIFSSRFDGVHDDILKDTQVEVTGHLVDGSSVRVQRLLRGGGADFTHVVVEFATNEGDMQDVTKEVSEYEFKRLYKGQTVPVLYSKINPRNIAILIDDDSYRKFKNSSERDFTPDDLLRLLSIKPTAMVAELNKIAYGWVYVTQRKMWVNNRKQSAVNTDGRELRFIGDATYNLTYPDKLIASGFTKTSTDGQYDLMHTGLKIFENKQYTINISAIGNQDEELSVISVVKK